MASSRKYKTLQEFGRSPRESYTPSEAASLLREVLGIPNKCQGELKTFKKILNERGISEANIKILITGRVGRGKSTLANSIIDLGRPIAVEGGTSDAVTNEVTTHSYEIDDDIQITLVDSPGLQHGECREDFYSSLVEDLMIKGDDTSLVLYCRKMTEDRFEEDELKAIKKLYQTFGSRFWERVVIVMTFANEVKLDEAIEGDPPFSDVSAWDKLIEERFKEKFEERCNGFKKILQEKIPIPVGVVHKIRFTPAGYYKPSRQQPNPFYLPGRENWLCDLLELCCDNTNYFSLSKLTLRENLHLAVIIDNEGPIPITEEGGKNDSQDEVALNDQAEKFKIFLEKEKFMVLSFNSLSPDSIARLVEALTTNIESQDLAAFALFIFCKGKTCNDIDMKSIVNPIGQTFPKVPKIFVTHFAEFKRLPPLAKDDLPLNSISFKIASLNMKSSKIPGIFEKKFKEVYTIPIKNCFEAIGAEVTKLEDCSWEIMETFGEVNRQQVLPSIFVPQISKARLGFLKKKLDIQRVMWRTVRSDTVDALFKNKDEIRKLLRNERIARIGTGVTGVLIGGGLVIGGIVAAPFTFGASIGLSVAGGAIGAAASMGGIGAFITRKVIANSSLKKAQDQVTFDQQFSRNLNKAVAEYYEAVHDHFLISSDPVSSSSTGEVGVKVGQAFTAIGGGVGMAVAIGAEGAIEGGALALRTAGRIAGAALAGASLAVTVPIDIAFIAYHSYRIHQANKDEGGATEKDEFVKWFIQQIEGLLIETVSIGKYLQTTETEVKLPEFGIHIQAPLPEKTFTVRTLFSGPFILPKGSTLVSAVYDIFIVKPLDSEVLVDIEHCVDLVSDRSNSKLMSFAIGTLDLKKKAYTFTLLEKGGIRDKTGTVQIKNSCMLCIVYTGPLEKNPLKYAALCAYAEEYRNSWNLKILFTKHLSSHLKFFEREFPIYNESSFHVHPFKLCSPITGVNLERLSFDDVPLHNPGWVIALVETEKRKVLKVTKKQLDSIEMQHDLSDSPVLKIPSIELCVQVSNEVLAVVQFDYSIPVQGTDLRLRILRTKMERPTDV